MPKLRHHRSSRRAPGPKDSDFDHEIHLVDRDDEEEALRPPSPGPSSSRHDRPSSRTTNGQTVEVQDTTGAEEREEEQGQPSVTVEQPTPLEGPCSPGFGTQIPKANGKPKTPESAIDILYENERGGFLCGIPLFSSGALGNLDPPAWTNYAHRPSPTDISTAQVPDPSWEWAWPEWRINRDEGVDEDGWVYSFAFSKKFSWHQARWWNSFVRRRAWIRKRVKKDGGYLAQDPLRLGPEYFTVRPSSELARERTPSRASSRRGSRLSMATVDTESVGQLVIEHAEDLMAVLRVSRIDREKIEAINNYLANAKEELEGLQGVMHEIMALFVFQASRRVLVSKLTQAYDKAVAELEEQKDKDPELERRAKHLSAAVEHADEEVRRLEYWSDVKSLAEEGDSKGAVDHAQGWDRSWQGVDKSGPPPPPTPEK